jgi:formylmethanofuran dehydrogenase subunit B
VSTAERVLEHATCLGCGCACDDIAVVVRRDRIVAARQACAFGVAWFGDGVVPQAIRSGGRKKAVAAALADAATLLADARRPLVYLSADLTCETQREGVAIADRLGALLDSPASDGAAPSILAAQRRGRAGATLGEIRQRADLLVFWGVDPAERYPRYGSRYAVEPAGLQTPDGRRSRTIIAVDVGPARGPADADARVSIAPDEEIDALALMQATVLGHAVVESDLLRRAGDLARRMMQARYVALVHDGEPSPSPPPPPPVDTGRAEGLIALAQALNGPTRCALSILRAGGNGSGAEAVMTWQTGFPFAVDFARGHPRYRPHAGAAVCLARGEIDAALVLGSPAGVPEPVATALAGVPCVAIGPRASEGAKGFTPTIAVDTGVPGIHEAGTALRMDDVPLPLRAMVAGPPTALEVVRALAQRLAPA